MGDTRGPGAAFLLGANLLVLGVLTYAAVLESRAPAFYYASLQEDAYLEWATFWGFLAAAALFFVAATRQRRERRVLPWFLCGVGLFCFVVGMEEISWGQRVLGYRPPVYFLEHNFQQELNVHNVVSTSLRKLALKGSILGYGVFLPLAALARPLRRRLEGWAIEAPPAGLIPAFFATYYLYETYPWKFSGEVVELMLALGFVAAALAAGRESGRRGRRRGLAAAAPVAVAGIAVLGAGIATEMASRWTGGDDAERVEAARMETERLARDFRRSGRGGTTVSRCGVHKRVYSFLEKYDTRQLESGAFSRLVARGLPQERASFFLDPWNSPYWIRDECDRRGRRREVFVYSFGPNRRRDSTDWEILGDDVGATIVSVGG